MAMNPSLFSRGAALRGTWRHWLLGTSPTPPPLWVQVAWTIVCSAAIALGFATLSFVLHASRLAQWFDPHEWLHVYWPNLVVSLTIGFIIQALFKIGFAALGRGRLAALEGWRRSAFFIAVPLLGVAIGWPIGMTLVFGDLRQFAGLTSGNVMALVVITLVISVAFHVFFSMRTKEIRAEMRANEAQLRLLQGQMEPHFLFNSLANVICLIDTDAPRAKHSLEALTDYLRASLGSLRRADGTLGMELDLATSYLQLMQTRMGDRLRFEIEADAQLRGAALAPLLLQPLIENAVKHGLEPQVDGGTVRVVATRIRHAGVDALQVCVEDNGAGLAAAAARGRRTVAGGPDGHGIALANLRERLLTRFDSAASLTLTELPAPGGTRCCLLVPWHVATAA